LSDNHQFFLSLKRGWPTGIKRLIALLTFTACVLCWPQGAPASERISISGYYKNYSTALDQPEVDNLPEAENQPVIGAVNNRLRLNVSGRLNQWMSLTLAYDFSPRVQDKSLFEEQTLNLGLNPQIYRAVDLDSRLYPEEDESVASFAIFQNLDRACLTINSRPADVYLGRQAIAWGSARVINPTDVLVPYAFNQLDTEDRIGVDAVRVRVPTGFMGEIDGGYVFGDDFEFEKSAMFLRGKFYYRRTDISLLAVGFQENLLAGFDLTRSFGGAGFWLEGAYVFASALNSDCDNGDEDYLRGSVGADYSLKNGAYLFVEYHFNQAGAGEPEQYLADSTKIAYREGSVYLLGKHYLAPGISYQLTPLITLSGQALINVTDPSVFLMPQAEYNVAKDVYLSAGAYLGLGESPYLAVSPCCGPAVFLRSEFGGYPHSYFVSFRLYF
jgi:hypothetical protein